VCHQNAEQGARSPESFEAIEARSLDGLRYCFSLPQLCSAEFCTIAKEQHATISSPTTTEERSDESTADVDNDENDDNLAGKETTTCKGNTMIVRVIIICQPLAL